MPIRAAVLVLAPLTAVLAACGGAESASDSNSANPGSRCARMAVNVDKYDILAPGASRTEYLTLLHKLQRDCPDEAKKAGLTGETLPQCKRLAQENCTMSPEAPSASPPPARKFGLPAAKRKRIFADLVRYQDKHPGHDEEAYTVIAKGYGVPEGTVHKIAVEGVEEGWLAAGG